jgi:hypothetical protein
LIIGLNPEDDAHIAMAYMILEMAIQRFKGTPWSIYHKFVIEERHGFNKITLK